MLYITTRDNNDAYTAHRTLMADCAPDGGCFVPFQLPYYEANEIALLKEKTFSQTVAEFLNTFFSAGLTALDVDFAIGKIVSKLIPMNHKIVIAELWHNPDGKYSYIEECLYKLMVNCQTNVKPSAWAKTAVRIAILFGLYGQMLRSGLFSGDQCIDISVSADDFSVPMTLWYARKMGLPIGSIICVCVNNGSLWDLIHRGVFNPAEVSDTLLLSVEQLIHACLGFDEVRRFQEVCRSKRSYTLNEEQLAALNIGLFCAVAGDKRWESITNSVFRSNSYIIDPQTALSYGGLQDYRAKTGGSRTTLLLAENTPMSYTKEISGATGIPADKLIDHVNLS